MPGPKIPLPEVVNRKLDGHPPLGFDCGRQQQNAFLYDRAWLDQKESLSTTYLFYVGEVLAAYATLFMDSLPLSRRERGTIPYRNVSSLKLGQLAVDRRFQGRGVGRYAIGFSIHLAAEVSDRVACRYVTLDAESDLVGWYGRFGFTLNRLHQKERMEDAVRHKRDPNHIPVSMRLDLRPD
jgi:GNAT superfamily N-acetyltransferase